MGYKDTRSSPENDHWIGSVQHQAPTTFLYFKDPFSVINPSRKFIQSQLNFIGQQPRSCLLSFHYLSPLIQLAFEFFGTFVSRDDSRRFQRLAGFLSPARPLPFLTCSIPYQEEQGGIPISYSKPQKAIALPSQCICCDHLPSIIRSFFYFPAPSSTPYHIQDHGSPTKLCFQTFAAEY